MFHGVAYVFEIADLKLQNCLVAVLDAELGLGVRRDICKMDRGGPLDNVAIVVANLFDALLSEPLVVKCAAVQVYFNLD